MSSGKFVIRILKFGEFVIRILVEYVSSGKFVIRILNIPYQICQVLSKITYCKYDKNERATTTAATATEESPGRLQPPFPSRPGIQYPVRAYPSLRL